MELKRQQCESLEQYLWRIGNAKDNGETSLNWHELADIINPQFFVDSSDYLGEAAFRKRYSTAKKFYDDVFSRTSVSETVDNNLRQIQMERKKLQTEKIEYNRWLREQARDEMIFDGIIQAVAALPPIQVPVERRLCVDDIDYLLAFGDAHYGAEFELRGLSGELINNYSPEVFEARMWDLYHQVLALVDDLEITHLYIANLGDHIDGLLRVSQLMKLRYGVVDSTIYYAEFLANWLNELTKSVNITYTQIGGNHDQLRELGQPKNTFDQDNMSKIILEFIKTRLTDNPNFKVVENPTGNIFLNIDGYTVLGVHGEEKNMEKAINDFSRIYGVEIQYLLSGHQHHFFAEDVGVQSRVLRVPSIIGTDPYALSLGRNSEPGAELFGFVSGKGLTVTYDLKL